MAAVVLADPGLVRAVDLALPADVVGGRADVLPADNDMVSLSRKLAPR